MGDRTNAVGTDSTAMGYASNAIGNSSFAGGWYYVNSSEKTAGGTAYGDSSFAFGIGAIAGVADGVDDTNAETVIQMNNLAGMTGQAIGEMQNQLGFVSNEMREVGAISAVLSGLHFAEQSSEAGDNLVGAVAYGWYIGSNTEAIGLAYKPSPNMMLSASTSISNGNDRQNTYNVGFSLNFGKGETAQTRAALQKQVKYLNEEVHTLRSELEELKKLILRNSVRML